MQLTLFEFLRQQLGNVPVVEYEDLSGKTVVVIGANDGIGFEATKHFARMNPGRLILGCRSKERGEAAITSETKPPPCCLISHHLLTDFFKNWKQKQATSQPSYGILTLLEFLQSSILSSDLKRTEGE